VDHQLAAAVVATLGDIDPVHHRARLEAFPVRRWQRNFRWLDASGLALYFLHRLRTLDLQSALPGGVLAQLERRHADNKLRSAALFEEFLRINQEFQSAGVRYAVLKGFSLIPDYCPDMSLRYQMDLDFLVDRRDAERCAGVLRNFGYTLVKGSGHGMEFKTAIGRVPRVADLYRPRPQRSVELHPCRDAHSRLLNNARLGGLGGCFYPVLSAEDMFLSQVWHLFHHLRQEWTRISWLQEFHYFVAGRQHDADFWLGIKASLADDQSSTIALGTVASLARKAFGEFSSDPVTGWAMSQLPSDVARWIDRFAGQVLYADFPGSKLYLLLERALSGGDVSTLIRRRLLPRKPPPPIVQAPSDDLRDRAVAAAQRWKYFFFRLRFHISAGARYLFESWRWNRLHRAGDVSDT
jgi:hypothetical protein